MVLPLQQASIILQGVLSSQGEPRSSFSVNRSFLSEDTFVEFELIDEKDVK